MGTSVPAGASGRVLQIADGGVGRTGRILVHTGDGKGKTTAALGTAFRAAGHGQNVAIVQFMKGKWTYGEIMAVQRFPNMTLVRMGSGFTWQKVVLDEDRELAARAWATAQELAASRDYDLLVLDELNYAIDYGFVPVEEVVRFLRGKPADLSVIITGRRAKQEIIDAADTVTEMRAVKHAFRSGTRAQKGIEF